MEQRLINYAKAAYELGIESCDLFEPINLIEGSPELTALYKDLSVAKKDRQDITLDIASSCHWSDKVKNFLAFLSSGTDILRLSEISDGIDRLKAAETDVLDARLFCVHPPTDSQKEQIERYLMNRFHKGSVNLHIEIHEDLIGGFVLVAGGITINRSMQRTAFQLERVLKFR